MTTKSRVLSTFIVLCIYLALAVFLVPQQGRSLAYSVFYSSRPGIDGMKNKAENEVRVKKAKEFLKNKDYKYLNETSAPPEFCFVIISVSRPAHTHYLTQVVASLVPQIADGESVFTVYNAEGSTHQEAMNLSRIVPVETFSKHDSAKKSKYVKEKEDYTRALEWCSKKQSQFSVIFQDDALPPKYFMDRLKFILQYRVRTSTEKWAFLKLYYPEKWEGWSKEWQIILELIATSSLGAIILVLITHFIQSLIIKTMELDTFSIGVKLTLAFLLVLFALLTLGRPHWLALRNVSQHFSSVVVAPGCCIPAVVYPQMHLSSLIAYLEKTECSRAFPVDLALDKFAHDNNLDGLLVVPNLVKHIGFLSSLGKGWKNPREFRI